MPLKITAQTTTCNGIDVDTAAIEPILQPALGAALRTYPTLMGSDIYTNDTSDVRAAILCGFGASGSPVQVLGSAEYSALIKAIALSEPFINARAAIQSPSVPVSVPNWKARLLLLRLGKFERVDAKMQALGALSEAYQAWEYAPEYHRASVLINEIGAELGYSAAQLDDLFRAADRITA